MTKTNTIHFGIQRKIVANMTTESWQTIPHVSYMYEPDVTGLIEEYKKMNLGRRPDEKVSLNTLTMKIITEGLKAAPIMNSHIKFDSRLVRGRIDSFKEINISMPMILPNGEMMTVNLRDFHNKSLNEMDAYIADVKRKAENTNLEQAMFEVSLNDTLTKLKKGKALRALYRFIGSKTGKHKVKTLSGSKKKEYYAINENDRLTKADLEQGTVTISNIGSLYKNQKGSAALLEVIPPQVCAFAVGAIQERPLVITDDKGNKTIEARKVLPLCIAFDHRAMDFGECVPFIKALDEIFENPATIHKWNEKTKTSPFVVA